MFCSFVIANNNFEHIFNQYLNYVFASGYLALSTTVLSVLLESYLKKVEDDAVEDEMLANQKSQNYYP